jgi:signal transduction histidine kinase
MRIRTRLTLWFSGILFVALVAMGVFSYFELVAEPREKLARGQAGVKEELQENETEELLGIFAWCAVPALVLSIGGGWWMMQKALAPVNALTQAAQRLNEHTLGQPLPSSGNGDELDQLTQVFNAMSQRLEQSFQRVREFTLHASHELKTPLTVMRGELETALQETGLSPAQRVGMESELDEIQRLTTIVDGLSLLTKADAGLVKLEFRPVQLDELVQEIFADCKLLAQAKSVQVELEQCEGAVVQGDSHRLRQLLLNLADNAVKYNESEGSIRMALRREGDAAVFTMSNTGPGIASSALNRVFDRFFRGDPSHNSHVEGCGLGLSIAQWIVSVHNGTIKIASESGKLTTVTVRLPLGS